MEQVKARETREMRDVQPAGAEELLMEHILCCTLFNMNC